MSAAGAKRQRSSERATAHQSNRGALPAIGMEAEFTTVVDGIPQKPEDVFGSPRAVVRGPLVHRAGKSTSVLWSESLRRSARAGAKAFAPRRSVFSRSPGGCFVAPAFASAA